MANTKVTSRVLADDAVTIGKIHSQSDNGAGSLGNQDPTDGYALVAKATSNDYYLSWESVSVSGISSSADATAITIDSSERVGIGTASITEKTTINGALSVTGAVSTNPGSSGTVSFESITGVGDGLSLSSYAADATGLASIFFRTGYGGATPDIRMTIDGAGRVGVGTAGGNAGITCSTDIRAAGASFANDANTITISQESGGGFITARGPDTSTRGTLNLSVNRSNGAAGITALNIDNSGNVNVSPATKLQVSGGDIVLDGDQEIQFLTQSTSTAYGKIFATDYPSQGYTSSGSGSTVSNRFWPTISSAGGVFLVLNTDGGTGSNENSFDSFVVWQGERDGDQLFKVSNAGNTSTRRLAINSAGSETTFIPNGSGLDRVDLMVRSYTSGEHHGQVIACDNDGEAHLLMVDTANNTGSASTGGSAGGWGLDIYYSGDTSYPYNLRTGQSGTWTQRERIAFDGTREFMNSELQHNDSYRSVQWKWMTTPYYWYASTTSNTTTSIAYNGFTTNGNSTMPSNIKALYVTYYYHISGYNRGSGGQGDHASDIWGPDASSATTSWSFTTSGNVDWGAAMFMHDGDTDVYPGYYGIWFPGAIIPVNSNGSIYGNLAHGYSGGTHYHHMYVWGYAT